MGQSISMQNTISPPAGGFFSHFFRNKGIRDFVKAFCSGSSTDSVLAAVNEQWYKANSEAFAATIPWNEGIHDGSFLYTIDRSDTIYAINLRNKEGKGALSQSLNLNSPVREISLLDGTEVFWNQSYEGLELYPLEEIKESILIYKVRMQVLRA